jgi:hypothetical protein
MSRQQTEQVDAGAATSIAATAFMAPLIRFSIGDFLIAFTIHVSISSIKNFSVRIAAIPETLNDLESRKTFAY